jgi:hypothetical protein
MKLSQGSASSAGDEQSEDFSGVAKKEIKGTALSGPADKLKASNFPASLLRIGSWEVSSLNFFFPFFFFIYIFLNFINKRIKRRKGRKKSLKIF